MIATLFFPIWEKRDFVNNEIITINAFQLTYESYDPNTGEKTLISSKNTIVVSILAILAAAVAAFSIFQYNNRLNQIKLGALNALLMAATLGSAFYFIYKSEELLPNTVEPSYLFGFYTIMIGLVFNMLANRFIRKDENLVRSADRIR
jgi:TRAP-type uncharacterized transport system fused permease subunit